MDYVSLKDKNKMIKCNITACGTIGRDASMRTTKEEKTFLTFPLRVVLQGKDGRNETVEISVSKEGGQKKVSGYRNGLRVEVAGTLFLKRRGEKLYFNLFADRIGRRRTSRIPSRANCRSGARWARTSRNGKDKKDKSYTMFSAFSTEKVDENFEYQWVRFFCFDRQREEWLQPGVKVEAKGEMTVSVHNGKPDISCRVEELAQYIPESDNFNQ